MGWVGEWGGWEVERAVLLPVRIGKACVCVYVNGLVPVATSGRACPALSLSLSVVRLFSVTLQHTRVSAATCY